MIDKIVKNKMIDKLLDPVFNKDVKNINTLKSAIRHMISDSDMDMLMFILCDEEYEHLNQGEIVTWKPEKWELKDKVEMDRMKDWGLMKNGYLFGKVMNSADYKDEFNPFYYEMTVDMFICDEANELVTHECRVKTLKLNKSEGPKQWKEKMKSLE